jgi:hypothetical protein
MLVISIERKLVEGLELLVVAHEHHGILSMNADG